jgi:putative ABC transport system ATP-binding protein
MQTTTNGSLIHLEGITKVFFTDEVETHALSGIHLEIKKGEYFSIAGPSGCGKSTLLSILGLLDSPTEGSYILNGQPVANLGMAERARIRNREVGFISSFNLIGDLTVFENVELPLTYAGWLQAKTQDSRGTIAGKVGMSQASIILLSFPAASNSASPWGVGRKPAILWRMSPESDSKNGEAVIQLLQICIARSNICMVTHDPLPQIQTSIFSTTA